MNRGVRVPFDGDLEQCPRYATDWAAGADLRAALAEPLCLAPAKRVLVPTGIRLAVPEGFECQIRPRSGWALRTGVTVLNSPGTIDADYRGEIRVLLINHGDEIVKVCPGDRIAQLVLQPVYRAEFVFQQLNETARGSGGFGSTGNK